MSGCWVRAGNGRYINLEYCSEVAEDEGQPGAMLVTCIGGRLIRVEPAEAAYLRGIMEGLATGFRGGHAGDSGGREPGPGAARPPPIGAIVHRAAY